MQKQRGKDAIRLTNRTAIALRKSARSIQRLYITFAVLLTVLLIALAVFLGLKWLIAVPLLVAAAVLLDAVILLVSRTHYLSLTAQAICTEAAARQMRGERQEKQRRRQALSDLQKMKEDAQNIGEAGIRDLAGKAESDDIIKTDEAEEPAYQTDDHEEEIPLKRRRRQAAFQVIHGEQAT